MKKTSLILGLGFGDEGKGRVVSSLAARSDPDHSAVVRFSGGHQAGHGVEKDGIHHIFSSFGSGTLHGLPTFWSRFCTVYPVAIVNELKALREKFPLLRPKLYLDPLAPVTTPWDVTVNRREQPRGTSVGVGYGATIARHKKFPKLHAQDLFYTSILKPKLALIAKQLALQPRTPEECYIDEEILDNFLATIGEMFSLGTIRLFDKTELLGYEHLIFEGSQGIMLDQDYGFFPYVTRGKTTAHQAFQVISEWGWPSQPREVCLVTRAYATRHGNGPFPGEGAELSFIKDGIDESNSDSGYQGIFRKAPLHVELLRYALENALERSTLWGAPDVCVTCVDHLLDPGKVPIIIDDKLEALSWKSFHAFVHSCGARDTFITTSRSSAVQPQDIG